MIILWSEYPVDPRFFILNAGFCLIPDDERAFPESDRLNSTETDLFERRVTNRRHTAAEQTKET